jgi:hypothetical protein
MPVPSKRDLGSTKLIEKRPPDQQTHRSGSAVPAQAGLFRPQGAVGCCRGCRPRAGGVVPSAGHGSSRATRPSPRRRGCSGPAGGPSGHRPAVPAQAGFPARPPGHLLPPRRPRAGGVVPTHTVTGQFLVWVVPAQAGLFLVGVPLNACGSLTAGRHKLLHSLAYGFHRNLRPLRKLCRIPHNMVSNLTPARVLP